MTIKEILIKFMGGYTQREWNAAIDTRPPLEYKKIKTMYDKYKYSTLKGELKTLDESRAK